MCFYSLFHDKIKKKRGDPTEIGHSREGASTKAYVIINQKSEGKTKMGKLYFRYGAMGSSKTANLLMVHYNFLERGRRPVILKPKCELIEEFTMKPDTYDAILVDEANFLSSEQVEWLAEICDQYDIPVLCYGLKTDFRGVLFEGSKRLMELADAIEEHPIICCCGKKAHFNARVIDGKMVRDGAQIALGANDMYVPLCRRHFMSGEIKPYQTVEEK